MTINTAAIADLAGQISERAAAWQDYGYEVPPPPGCKPVPPLGERSAAAINAGHGAIAAIDDLLTRLHALRGQLAGELRQDSDIRGARVDAMLERRRPAPGDLTGRENEVARLVADGLTNREIALRLVVSRRTVDCHLDHIMRKLGCTSRVQVAVLVRGAAPEGSPW